MRCSISKHRPPTPQMFLTLLGSKGPWSGNHEQGAGIPNRGGIQTSSSQQEMCLKCTLRASTQGRVPSPGLQPAPLIPLPWGPRWEDTYGAMGYGQKAIFHRTLPFLPHFSDPYRYMGKDKEFRDCGHRTTHTHTPKPLAMPSTHTHTLPEPLATPSMRVHISWASSDAIYTHTHPHPPPEPLVTPSAHTHIPWASRDAIYTRTHPKPLETLSTHTQTHTPSL